VSGGRQHYFVVAGAKWWWPEKMEGKKFGGESERGKLKMTENDMHSTHIFFIIKGG
jgi:hypothetical protein